MCIPRFKILSTITVLMTVACVMMSNVIAESQRLKLAGIFGDHMVIQRDTNAPIWGHAKAGGKVTVSSSWKNKSIETVANDQGKWSVEIPTPKAGKKLEITIKSGDETIELNNVLSGDVWICSGQSNMQWKLRGFGPKHFKEDVDKAKYPQIRLCTVPQVISLESGQDVNVQWQECSPQTALNFSAVGYFFGSRIHEELDVPIGLVSCNWGGSAIEGWIRPEVLETELSGYKEQTENYEKWKEEGGITYTRSSKKPKGLNQSSPSVLYHGMLQPLIPLAFSGVIWYQGESNVSRPLEYRELFPAMIRDWRAQWGRGDFPFYYVQIAPWEYKKEPLSAAYLREAQMMALTEPNTGMVVTMDVGDLGNIHPKEKKPVGERLALLALARHYGSKDIVDSGPLYQSFKVEGDKVRLKFDHVGGGLAPRDTDLTHFAIAGSNKKFVPAEAVIDGDSILVHSKKVRKPEAVRFAWGSGDEPNLANKEGLPASSFRTDSWTPEK